MKKFLKCLLALLILFSFISPHFAQNLDDLQAKRRKEQFPKEPGYLVLPTPYSIPGIGEGFLFVMFASNIADTNLDAAGILIQGDVEGSALGFLDLHLYPKTLILDGGVSSIKDRKSVV